MARTSDSGDATAPAAAVHAHHSLPLVQCRLPAEQTIRHIAISAVVQITDQDGRVKQMQ